VCDTAGILFQKPNPTTENIIYPRKSMLRKYPLLEYNQTIMQTQITRITIENSQCSCLVKGTTCNNKIWNINRERIWKEPYVRYL